MMIRNLFLKAHPATLLLGSFLLTIALGAILLKLPIATTQESIPWVDALFTATSAVCVTGLAVVDTGTYFTIFGQMTILFLIQIGGLGLMTLSVALFLWIGKSISFRQRMVMQDVFAHTPRKDIYDLVKNLIYFTLGAEALGALILFFHWRMEFPVSGAIYQAVFHAISAFCNAGFALFPDSLMRYSDAFLVNATICALIVVGGIGFPVLYDLKCLLASRSRQQQKLSVQSKTVLITTLVLILAGAMMFAFLERYGSGENPTLSHRILTALFQSITCRTAGFNTVDIGALNEATLVMMIFLMFFGASPGSCGGGVKTTTLAVLAAFTLSRIFRKRRVNLFKKSVPVDTVNRSISLILTALALIGLVVFMILVSDAPGRPDAPERSGAFLAYLFETVSAFATVGLSMGVTATLSSFAKCWIIFMMIIGRVGVLTFSYIIVGIGPTNGIEYSEENLMIG